MPDLLSHILIVYILYKPTDWFFSWFSDRALGVVMIGAMLPDLAKIRLVLPTEPIDQMLGQKLILNGIHRLGPTTVLACIGAMLFKQGKRRQAFTWLMAGAGLHLALDLTVKRAGGVAPPYLYPLTWWEPPALNLLQSSDTWPYVITSLIAISIWFVDRRVMSTQ